WQGWKKLIQEDANGNVGIGTGDPKSKLTVGPAFSLSAHSPTFSTNAGQLGESANNELNLGSIGFYSGNESSLGVRALRTANGNDWTTTAIGLEMDVDNTPRAGGATVWLHANGNIGIGTAAPASKLTVAGDIRIMGGGLIFPDGSNLSS